MGFLNDLFPSRLKASGSPTDIAGTFKPANMPELEKAFNDNKQLKCLSLDNINGQVTPLLLSKIAENFPNLDYLDISEYKLDQASCSVVALFCHKLTRLDIKSNTDQDLVLVLDSAYPKGALQVSKGVILGGYESLKFTPTPAQQKDQTVLTNYFDFQRGVKEYPFAFAPLEVAQNILPILKEILPVSTSSTNEQELEILKKYIHNRLLKDVITTSYAARPELWAFVLRSFSEENQQFLTAEISAEKKVDLDAMASKPAGQGTGVKTPVASQQSQQALKF